MLKPSLRHSLTSLTPRHETGLAVGAIALGAFALGAMAIGALAIGRLRVARARIDELEIDKLIIHEYEAGAGHPRKRKGPRQRKP